MISGNNLNSISDTVIMYGEDVLAPASMRPAGIARARAAAGAAGKSAAASASVPEAQARSGTHAIAVARARIVATAASRIKTLARQNGGGAQG